MVLITIRRAKGFNSMSDIKVENSWEKKKPKRFHVKFKSIKKQKGKFSSSN